MNIFTLILTILSVVYVFLAFNVIRLDNRSPLNRLFFALILSLIIWSFSSAVYISANDEVTCIFWYKLSSVGSYFFISLALHFYFVFAKKENLLKKWWIYIIIYLPSVIFTYKETTSGFYAKSYTHGSNGWIVTAQTDSLWFWAFITFMIVYIGSGIIISYKMQKRATSLREQKQARVLIFTTVLSLFTGLALMVIASILELNIPDIAPMAIAIWAFGIYYSIVKYKLMAMTPSFIAENLFQTIIDSIILTDPIGLILDVNPEAEHLLGYNQIELVGEPLESLFLSDNQSKNKSISELLNTCPVRSIEASVISKNGEQIPIALSISEYKDNYNARVGFVLVFKDVTENKRAEEQIKYLATHDSLTGLPNRLMFTQLLKHSIQSAKHHKRNFAVFLIDLDRFKIINDTKGHEAGDQVLQEIALRYKLALGETDVVSRQGGDEFVILIEEFKELNDLRILADIILSNTLKPIKLSSGEGRVTASIGISTYPEDGEDAQSLIKNADTAMYYAKEEGKNSYQFYTKNIQSISTKRLDIEINLRHALEKNEFSLQYQAKVNFKTGMITGVEALLRWHNPYLGSVTPTQFIPVAEETGMIVAIGEWVLKTACTQNVAWQKQGLPTIPMAVNLSLRQLTDSNLIEVIKAVLNDSGMDPGLLELEITESMMMNNTSKMITLLDEIKALGVRLVIDDFGTGYSSLSQIQNLPIDTLKIDRSFIRSIPENERDNAIIHAIITMGETLGLTVVAEGVETVEQMDFLKKQSCDEMQGYFFSKPIEPDKFAELLNDYVSTGL